MKLETKAIVINGRKVRYLNGGAGRPLLFLHGWPTNPPTYHKALHELAKRFTVYAPFMFDLNPSSVTEIAAGIKSLIWKLNLKAINLVGISFGGAVAAIVAGEEKRISKLVLIGPAGVPRTASLAKMLLGSAKSSAHLILKGHFATVMHRMLSIAGFFSSFGRFEARTLFAEVRSSTKVHMCHVFNRVPVSTSIIWCKNDHVFSYEHAEPLQKLIKGSKLIPIDGDHYWPMHSPKHLAQTVFSALK